MSYQESLPGKYGADTTLPLQRLHIAGRYVDASSQEVFDTVNPATNEVICQVQQAGEADVNHAVAAAQEAFKTWSRTPAVERGNILRRAAQLLRERNDELAELETLDTGKPIQETREVDIITGAEVLEYYAGLAQSLHGDHIDLPPEAFAMMRREPLGVCAGIGAWNYPIQIAMWKAGPALACGNTMVFKPAELTPLTTLKLAEIFAEAGLPAGVFNVVQGDGRTGQLLSRHPGVAKVTLTGEAETGKLVMADAATSSLKHVTFELGGKSPLIIFDDADMESAVNAALFANFFSAGEVCSNGTRVFVQRGIYDAFVAQLRPRVEQMRIGDPFDPETQVGALISRSHLDKVMSYIEDANAGEAVHVVGGERLTDGPLGRGNFVMPAIYADCRDDMRFVREEIFGPVMAVLPFDDEAEVLERANDTRYGLSGAVFTQDFARAHRVAHEIQAGSVWINDYNALPPEIPFGGYKHSGLGRENGLQAIETYTQIKTIYANLGKVPRVY
ncbi:betaine-aldehyde dehydrogenase [Halomonas sp. YLGW01]|uniref:betaine-aldehyde dehydrogenase n=1 Tax=Halomonas sp. YLGW01 TaxID=2773308 RepID=UPI0017806A7B|nr:betaine-aldehyde dehydrogenase [Halomonas sp. YLGW01]